MKRTYFLLFFFFISPLFPQTIEEKKAAVSQEGGAGGLQTDRILSQINEQMQKIKQELAQKMEEASYLQKEGASEERYHQLLEKVKNLKAALVSLQQEWKEIALRDLGKEDEGYGLWDLEETTLGALITEYGACDYLYVLPPEMASTKISMHSNLAIPKESWSEVLEVILAQSGIGVKPLNCYARQLYLFKQDPSVITTIAADPQDLAYIQDQRRIFYVFSPPIEQVKTVFQFFEKFSDPKVSYVYNFGNKVAIVSHRAEIEKLLNLYKAVWSDPKGKVSKVVPVSKMNIKEMEKILQNFFNEALEKPGRPAFGKFENEGLSILTPAHGNVLVLIGRKEIVDRAEKVVRDTENQLQDPAEMTIYLYNCQHSDPVDLAKILDKVYYSLLHTIPALRESLDVNYSARGSALPPAPDGYAQAPGLTVPPQHFKPEIDTKLNIEQSSEHFIPDPKTGNLLMVVRRDVLGRIKDLLRSLDVPKKMVQIEVLLFEKRLNNQSNYGLNLLKLGKAHNGARYDGPHVPPPSGLASSVGTGVLEFLFQGKKSSHFPAFDFAYSFLMTQEDIQLNAAPSVITVNQTPATISILEEISLNNGAAPIDTNKGIAFEKSFSRAQYGINIILTPIIHLPEEEEAKGFVTLQTNITFDTTKPSTDDRPSVESRHIENEVRVLDGETVILGGLRRKATRDHSQKIPFLGEIPGLGKLFGSTELTDNNTEMFFFITPHIIREPQEELLEQRRQELEKRPGDLPEFLKELVTARKCAQQRMFVNTVKMLFGQEQNYYE